MGEQTTHKQSSGSQSIETQLAVMSALIGNIQKSIDELKDTIKTNQALVASKQEHEALKAEVGSLKLSCASLEAKYESHINDYVVTKSNVNDLKKVVFGAITVILTLFLGAVATLVLVVK